MDIWIKNVVYVSGMHALVCIKYLRFRSCFLPENIVQFFFVLILQVSWHNTKKFNNFAGSQVYHATDKTCLQIHC